MRNDGGVYLTRWWIPLLSWICLALFGRNPKLHRIRRADKDRCHHDHPWSFWTFVLWGGYAEEMVVRHAFKRGVYQGTRYETVRVKPLRLYFREATYQHCITHIYSRFGAWTLVLTSPGERPWGFWVKGRFVYYKDFLKTHIGTRVAWCGGGRSAPVQFTRGDNDV